jgi:hypothetical protein
MCFAPWDSLLRAKSLTSSARARRSRTTADTDAALAADRAGQLLDGRPGNDLRPGDGFL